MAERMIRFQHTESKLRTKSIPPERLLEERHREAAQQIAGLIVDGDIPIELSLHEDNERMIVERTYGLVLYDGDERDAAVREYRNAVAVGLMEAANQAREEARLYAGRDGPCGGVLEDQMLRFREKLIAMASKVWGGE